MLADGGLEIIPYALGELTRVIIRPRLDGFKQPRFVAATCQRTAHAGDDGKAEPLCQFDMQRGHTGPHAEALDGCGGLAWNDVQIREQPGMSLTLERFDEFDHRVLLRDDGVAGVLAQLGEEPGESGVFEVLRHHGEGETAEAPDHAHQLEVAEMRGDPHTAGAACLVLDFWLRDVDVKEGLPVVLREPGGPEQVQKRPRKGLI